MADTTALKNRIRAAIKANDNQEITGPVLQQSLLDIVDELDLNPELENEAQQRQNSDVQLNNLVTGISAKVENLDSTVFESGEIDKSADLSGITNNGFIMAVSHNIEGNNGWRYGKIPIPFGSKTITFNNLPSTQYQGSVCSYFIDKDNNSIFELNGNDYGGVGVATKNIPSDAVGLMFTAATRALSNYDIKIHINKGSLVEQTQQSKTEIEQVQAQIEQILDEDSETFYQKEYLQSDENWFISGYFINISGNQVAGGEGESWFCTDFIPIFNKRIFVNAILSNQYGACAYCFYDENKNFISGAPVVSSGVIYNNVYIENIPDNAKYIRCTTKSTSNKAFVKIRYELEDSLNKEIDLQEQIDNINYEEISAKVENLDSTVFESGEIDKSVDLSGITNKGFIAAVSHNIEENTGWRYGKIPIPFGSKTITFNNLPSAQYQGSVCSYFIDKDNNSIFELNGNDYLGVGVATKNIPSDAVGLMFTAVARALSNYDIKIHTNQVSLVEQTQQSKTDIEQLQQEIQAQIEILIPDLIYAIEGTELNIWNDAVSLSIDNSLYSPRNYVIEWICNKGLVTKRCFRFTPTNSDVGTHSCTCSIYSPNTHNLIATKTFQIKVVSKNALNSQKRIVHFGDSLGRSTAEKLYENFNNTDKFTGVIPIMLGTRGTTPHYEAVGGYTWGSYATQGANQYRIQVTGVTSINIGTIYSYNNEQYNIREVNIVDGTGNLLLERPLGVAGNIDGVSSGVITRVSGSGDDTVNFTNCVREPNNPVWDSDLGGLNFAKYRERLGLSSSEKIDAATFQFGVNESLGTPNLTTALNNYILPLYNAFIADNPNGKFIVGMTTSAGNDVNGSGSNYGASINTWKYLVNTYNFRKMYLEELQNQYPNLIIAPSQLEVDRYYGYAFSSRQISQRTTATEQYHNNFVHPGTDGYGQLADALFATYVGALTEN